MTTLTSERQQSYNNKNECLTCGTKEFFFSKMIPTGMFCTSCGRPDVITETKFAAEEGSWD
jgi:ribosomal protein S14